MAFATDCSREFLWVDVELFSYHPYWHDCDTLLTGYHSWNPPPLATLLPRSRLFCTQQPELLLSNLNGSHWFSDLQWLPITYLGWNQGQLWSRSPCATRPWLLLQAHVLPCSRLFTVDYPRWSPCCCQTHQDSSTPGPLHISPAVLRCSCPGCMWDSPSALRSLLIVTPLARPFLILLLFFLHGIYTHYSIVTCLFIWCFPLPLKCVPPDGMDFVNFAHTWMPAKTLEEYPSYWTPSKHLLNGWVK